MRNPIVCISLIASFLFLSALNGQSPLFEKIDPSYSGIDFQNSLEVDVSTKMNLLDFDYFYNGGGVATADFNQDGLMDILLTGNQVKNGLFLNRGDFQFEDISQSSGVNPINKYWSNGVSIVDFNDDGYPDIYIAQGGPHELGNRRNLFLINNQDNTFTDWAEEYGVADDGISTHSVFFDFDGDGDEDLFVLNESILYGWDIVPFLKRVLKDQYAKFYSLSRLFINEGGRFELAPTEIGLTKPTFGLGVAVSDIDHDNDLDLYISNDYYIPDVLYLNENGLKFKDRTKQKLKQMAMFGMGVDIADLNGDTLQDILTLDMAAADHYRSKTLMASMNTERFDFLVKDLKFPYQYMYNAMQLNHGDGTFKNVSQLTGLSKTDWSWAGLIEDFDLDGEADVFVTNGYRKYGLDNDFKMKVNKTKEEYQGNVPLAVKQELYDNIPEGKLPNLFYKNNGGMALEEMSRDIGLADSTFSNGAAMADFDNDGDLDLIINNIDQTALLYKNLSVENGNSFIQIDLETPEASYAKVFVYHNGRVRMKEHKTVRGYRSSVTPILTFGFGSSVDNVDSIVIRPLKGQALHLADVGLNQRVSISEFETIKHRTGQLATNHFLSPTSARKLGLTYFHNEQVFDDFEKEGLLPIKQSQLGPKMSKYYMNGQDAHVLMVYGTNGIETQIYNIDSDRLTLSQSLDHGDREDMTSVFIDLNNDGMDDLIIASGGNEYPEDSMMYTHRTYLWSTSNQNFEFDNTFGGNFPTSKLLILKNSKKEKFLFSANRIKAQQYPRSAPSFIYKYENGEWKDATEKHLKTKEPLGIINDAQMVDYDSDGDADLVLVEEWGGIRLFENKKDVYHESTESLGMTGNEGWWQSMTVFDANDDGFMDLLVGNIGKNSKYKTSKEKPLKVFAGDFNEDGAADCVLSYEYNGEYVPFRGRECSSQQMPFIAENFPDYDLFATASIEDVYGEKLSEAESKIVTTFSTKLLLNRGGKQFESVDIPHEIQEFPLLTAVPYDFNDDGLLDILCAGNMYHTEPETPRLDSGRGLLLMASKDAQGNLRYDISRQSHLGLDGDVKDLELVQLGNKKYILSLENSGPLRALQINANPNQPSN